MDLLQIALIFLILLLSVFLAITGIQVFFILRDLKKALERLKLIDSALFFEEDVNNTTKNLSSIVEPIMMVAIGAVVGFFAISMIQPLYSSLAGL